MDVRRIVRVATCLQDTARVSALTTYRTLPSHTPDSALADTALSSARSAIAEVMQVRSSLLLLRLVTPW